MSSDHKQQIITALKANPSLYQQRPTTQSPGIIVGNSTGFCDQAKAIGCEVWRCQSRQEALTTIVEKIQHRGRDVAMVISPGLRRHCSPSDSKAVFGIPTGDAKIGISEAYAGIEDTGSLVMLGTPNSPTLLNFLPDRQFVLLSQERILKTKSAVWPLMKSENQPLPRSVNFISGPSRTADIEQTIQVGAHGPKNLTIVLID